jgi:hypothetical protein
MKTKKLEEIKAGNIKLRIDAIDLVLSLRKHLTPKQFTLSMNKASSFITHSDGVNNIMEFLYEDDAKDIIDAYVMDNLIEVILTNTNVPESFRIWLYRNKRDSVEILLNEYNNICHDLGLKIFLLTDFYPKFKI